MSLHTSVVALVESLLPFLPALRAKNDDLPEWVRAIAAKLLPRLEADKLLRDALRELDANPGDEDALGTFRFQLRKYLEHHSALDAELAKLLGPRNDTPRGAALSVTSLDRSDETLRRIEMVRLLRSGVPAERVAKQFKADTGFLFHLNAAFTAQGVLGLASGAPARRWLDQLNREDALLRRLEMVRLLRAGVPVELVAAEFGAATEYVERLAAKFTEGGSVGLIAEPEAVRYRELHPPLLRVATFNLHGVHEGDDARYRLIARELSAFEPDLVAFQEVIDGGGVRETSAQIAQRLSAMAGAHVRTFFADCHLYMEKYPEGVAVASHHAFENPQRIDLNKDLKGGAKPSMPRYAAAFQTEVHSRKVAFASTHLDHASDPGVRAAQALKLAAELDRLYPDAQVCVIAGDMNDIEGSKAITCFEERGYLDAYRACHAKGGNTFTSANPHARIDFILVKGADEIVSAQTGLAHPSLSDHLGVFAVIR